MVYADLHVHTTRSDGQIEPESVAETARDCGVSVVAVTDHDRPSPLDTPIVERHPDGGDPVTLVGGIELRVEAGDQRVDLLGYGLEHTPAVERTAEQIQQNRLERGRAIIDCVEDRLGIDLDLTPREGLGRPHIARAIDEHPDSGYDYEGAFRELIGDGDPCYVAREVPSFERGREVLDGACGVVGLAHPMRYSNPEAALELTADLDAVELFYPYDRPVDTGLVEAAVEDHDLLVTGGSDAHDHTLGRAGLSREEFEPIRARIVGD